MAEKVRKRLEEEVVFLFDPENISGSDYLNLFRHMRENRLRYLTYFKLGGSRYDAERYDRGLAQRYFDQRYVHYHMEFFRGVPGAGLIRQTSDYRSSISGRMPPISISGPSLRNTGAIPLFRSQSATRSPSR